MQYGAAALTLLAVLVAGWFFASGGYEKWRDERSVADACDGTVSVDQARALLGTDDVRGDTSHSAAGGKSPDGSSPPVICWLDGPGGYEQRAVVQMEWRSKAWGPHTVSGRQANSFTAALPVPIGGGWPGMVNLNDDGASATVVLECRNTAGPRAGDSLSLFVSSWGSRPYKEAAQRVRLARFATRTAQAAAHEYGCDARSGGRIGRVEPLDYGRETYQDAPGLAGASGTCAGITPGWRIKRAHGTAVGHAPVEDCLLIDDKGRPLFRLSAYYGTFADDQRFKTQTTRDLPKTDPLLTDFLFRAEATCPGSPRQAVFAIDDRAYDDDPKPQLRYARAALRDFAERSAARHGCTDVKLFQEAARSAPKP
ncbi:hypothetical protein OG453_38590 [Streptomyces sp. NBC_01381]|uniref:hypothetical protein n=1 Tax=Streptomyces sp. NBC_01381 TaxID=2903845 RepID=UPI00225053CA|nr:hypothetical protein [Streptomyces sp. NBC_01381]MCX4672491.1 hypothetical protein [Streptomyces sp. NBC_01381]